MSVLSILAKEVDGYLDVNMLKDIFFSSFGLSVPKSLLSC